MQSISSFCICITPSSLDNHSSLSLSLALLTKNSSMAISKYHIASIVLSLLVLDLLQAVQANQVTSNNVPDSTLGKPMDCGGACAARCSLSKRPRLCKRACGTCCARCQCVPPGTSGNLEVCPCYASLTTRYNKRKCP